MGMELKTTIGISTGLRLCFKKRKYLAAIASITPFAKASGSAFAALGASYGNGKWGATAMAGIEAELSFLDLKIKNSIEGDIDQRYKLNYKLSSQMILDPMVFYLKLFAEFGVKLGWFGSYSKKWEKTLVEARILNLFGFKLPFKKMLFSLPGSYSFLKYVEVGQCKGKVTLHQHGDQKNGWKATFARGIYDHPNFVKKGALNDDASSINVPKGCKAILYQHKDFKGWKAEFEPGNYPFNKFISKGAKNDDASAIKVIDF